MSSNTIITTIPDDLLKKVNDFKFRKPQANNKNSALVLKINQKTFTVELEHELLDSIAEGKLNEFMEDELPDNEPRYILLSYKYTRPTDKRVSYPLVFLYYSPETVKPSDHMMYAASKTHIVQKVDLSGKVFDVPRESEASGPAGEVFSDKWLCSKLAFFK
ncbi:hypothetical protein MP638_006886 [Amoeboaphelidium occidentale]|nr:hypothetical protein MP638_006886 [Amoeboaphelidium occidentale]